MCFVVSRELFYAWKGEKDPRPGQLETIDLYRQTHPRNKELQEKNHRHPDQQLSEINGSEKSPSEEEEESYHLSRPSTTSSYEFAEPIRKYMVDFFNHALPTSPPEPSLLGDVHWNSPHEDYTTWILTDDSSVTGSRKDWAKQMGRQLADVKPIFIVGGAELVSPALTYADLNWMDSVHHIYSSLQFDGKHGVWLAGNEGLHVHFGISNWSENDAISLETVKNVMVVYGVYLDEIEKWVAVERRQGQRGSHFCKSIRKGMETLKYLEGQVRTINRGLKYTPQQYAERIYACPSVKHVKKEVWGEQNADDPSSVEDMRDWEWEGMKSIAVNISLPRGNKKPLTLEFRQHEGTIDPVVIKWWVKFLGHLVNHAHTMAELGIRFREENQHSSNSKFSFAEQMTKRRSILEVIKFPKEGREHFAKRAADLHDQKFEDLRELEQLVIQARVWRRRTGQQSGRAMDSDIKGTQWWVDRANALDAKWNIIVPQVELGDQDSE
jgi:hypothetical protein